MKQSPVFAVQWYTDIFQQCALLRWFDCHSCASAFRRSSSAYTDPARPIRLPFRHIPLPAVGLAECSRAGRVSPVLLPMPVDRLQPAYIVCKVSAFAQDRVGGLFHYLLQPVQAAAITSSP